ncbi:MAG: recombinase family protein, partial [Candidatus Margulisiibacteriota bacterium]
MKAAIYTRVSTDGQAEIEFNSCETQEIKIRSYISSQNDLDVYKVYSDQGYSGANIDRPALQEMLEDIRQGKINSVMSYKIDRLTRSPKDFYQLIDVFEQSNVSFISVTERFDTSTPSGRLLRNIMLTFGQFERELISERIRDKMFERAKKGMWNSGHTPFGYKKENKMLIIEPKEAEIVRHIYDTYVSTGSVAAVYKELKNKKKFYRKGLPFANTKIDFILRNILYTGKINYKGSTIYKGIHEAIISEMLFEEAQKLHHRRLRGRKAQNYALFPGSIRCRECGSIMSSVFTNKFKNGRRVRYFYYRCNGIVKRDRSFCDTRTVSVDRLDGYVMDNLDKMAKNQQYLDSLIFTLNHGYQDRMAGAELNGFESYFTVDRTREILQTVVNASKSDGKMEKRLVMNKHIKEILYSKEVIEVVLFYGANCSPASINSSAITKARAPKQNTETVFCTHPKKTRQNSAAEKIIDEKKIADNKNGATIVCEEKMV